MGPEILLRHLEHELPYQPILVAEASALESVRALVSERLWTQLRFVSTLSEWTRGDGVPVLDPTGSEREVSPGDPTEADAVGAIAALDLAIELARDGVVSGMVTAPLSKETVARYCLPDFRGHTDYLAARCGLTTYGRDFLMAFIARELQVTLLTTHIPLSEAVAAVDQSRIVEALACLDSAAGGKIAVAGLNPHAGESGLLGTEERDVIRPAVEQARSMGIDAHGPESPDSLFARARGGEFDWVLALYHDQGLIPIKTMGFGSATNWTLGLPFVRTSVDHGTAFDIAGRGVASVEPLVEAGRSAVALIEGSLPRRG